MKNENGLLRRMIFSCSAFTFSAVFFSKGDVVCLTFFFLGFYFYSYLIF